MTQIDKPEQNSANNTGTYVHAGTQETQRVQPPFFEIATNHGPILVDEDDADLVAPFIWHAARVKGDRFYAHSTSSGKRIKMHRLLMKPPADLIVHHKNNNGLDNRRANLQITTHQVNIRYAYIGGKCVHLHKQTGRWRAQPRDETGKQISLGMYGTEEQARAAVQNWTYRKMLELEQRDDQESRDLAELIAIKLTRGELAKLGVSI